MIKKMIAEYESKVEAEDIRLLNLADELKERKAAKEDYTDLRANRIRIRARRQAYVQAAADFDALLDSANARLIAASPELSEVCKLKETGPEKVGELWKHESGIHAHTYEYKNNIYFQEDRAIGCTIESISAVIHNQNGWTRLYSPDEEDLT